MRKADSSCSERASRGPFSRGRKCGGRCTGSAWLRLGPAQDQHSQHSPRAWFISSKYRSCQAGEIISKNSSELCVLQGWVSYFPSLCWRCCIFPWACVVPWLCVTLALPIPGWGRSCCQVGSALLMHGTAHTGDSTICCITVAHLFRRGWIHFFICLGCCTSPACNVGFWFYCFQC